MWAEKRRCRELFFLLLGVVGILCYFNSLSVPFYFDDIGNIVGNKCLYLDSLTVKKFQNIFSPYQQSAGRKIANITFALNYYFCGLNPAGFHVVNIALHIINAWIAFSLFCLYFTLSNPVCKNSSRYVILAGLAALLWVTNPIQTNAVTYVVQRMTSLSTTFVLLSLIAYLKGRILVQQSLAKRGLIKIFFYFFVSFLCFICGVYSKEIAAILPVLVFFHEIYFFDFLALRKKYPKYFYLFCAFCCIVFVSLVYHFLGINFIAGILSGYEVRDFTLLERLLTESRVVFHYMSLFLFPVAERFHLYYDNYQLSTSLFTPVTTILSLLCLFAWIGAVFYFSKKNRLISFGLLWTLLSLLIESTFIPLEIVFEHRFYLPSLGFSLVVVLAVYCFLFRINVSMIIIYSVFIVMILSSALGTVSRNMTWQDELVFAMHEVDKNPTSIRALTNLSEVLLNKEHPVVAEKYLQQVLALDPESIVALNNLIVVYSNRPCNDETKMLFCLNRILQLVAQEKNRPTDNQVLYNLARFLYENKRYEKSLFLLRALQKNVSFPKLYLRIGQNFLELGRNEEAVAILEKSLKLDPANQTGRFVYALALKEVDQKRALKVITELYQEDISDAVLRNNINTLYEELATSMQP